MVTATPPAVLDVDLAVLAETRTRENLLTALLPEILGQHRQRGLTTLLRALRAYAHRIGDDAFLQDLCAAIEEDTVVSDEGRPPPAVGAPQY